MRRFIETSLRYCFILLLSFMNLSDVRLSCQQRNIPCISPETEAVLGNFLRTHRPRVCIEIWSAVWYSTLFIAETIKARWGYICGFERTYEAYLEALHHLRDFDITNAVLYPFDFKQTPIDSLIPYTFDFVFIDGQKTQYADYVQKIEGMLSPKAVVICDDVLMYKEKLSLLYWYFEKKQINYQIVDTEPGDGVLIRKK